MNLCDSCSKTDICPWSCSDGCKECKDYNKQTNEEWLRSATFEEMAGTIYEWHTKGYTKGRLGLGLNPVTEVIEWLKQPHSEVAE